MKRVSFTIAGVLCVALLFSGASLAQESEECGAACKAKDKAVKAKDWTKDKGGKARDWTEDKVDSVRGKDEKDTAPAKESRPKPAPAKEASAEDKGLKDKTKDTAVKAKDWTVDKGGKAYGWTKDKGGKAYGWTKDKGGNAKCNVEARRCINLCEDDEKCKAKCETEKAACSQKPDAR